MSVTKDKDEIETEYLLVDGEIKEVDVIYTDNGCEVIDVRESKKRMSACYPGWTAKERRTARKERYTSVHFVVWKHHIAYPPTSVCFDTGTQFGSAPGFPREYRGALWILFCFWKDFQKAIEDDKKGLVVGMLRRYIYQLRKVATEKEVAVFIRFLRNLHESCFPNAHLGHDGLPMSLSEMVIEMDPEPVF